MDGWETGWHARDAECAEKDARIAALESDIAAAYERGKGDERKRIRDNIVTDQATSAGDYGYAEMYADKIVKE